MLCGIYDGDFKQVRKMEEDRITIESLLYRIRKLDEKYEQLKWLVSGTEGSYIDSLLTQKGNISRKALNQMIEELISCLEDYRSYKLARQKGFGVQMEPYHLTDKESTFYRSYLYLLLGLTLQQNSGPMTRWCKPGTWDALIERVSYPMTYQAMAEIDRDLINMTELGVPLGNCPFRIPEGLFYDILCAYKDVTGKDFIANITELEREAAYKLMTDEEQYLITHPHERENREREENDTIEQLSKELGYVGPEEELSPEEMYGDIDDLYIDDDGSTDGWFKFFADDKERFVESCAVVRKQYCDNPAHGELKDEITTAIQFYLYRHDLSKWKDDDSFFAVYTYMNKALKASKKASED